MSVYIVSSNFWGGNMKKRFIGAIAAVMAASMLLTTVESDAAGDRPPKKAQTGRQRNMERG